MWERERRVLSLGAAAVRPALGEIPATRELVERFGQLFLLAFDGQRLSPDVAEFLRELRIGGVTLFADNYHDPEQLRRLTLELQTRCALPEEPLLIATDHEGGRVQRFKEGFTRLPPMAELGRGEPAATARVLTRAAAELAAAGINLCFAPVADLCPADRPGAIGDRSFGDDPERVAAHVAAAVTALRREGLLACVKHFPGHGATDDDSHRVLPRVTLDREQLDERDLVPFRAAIAAGVDAVMTAHVEYPEAAAELWPASLSGHWQRRVLRGELGFAGLIVADALEMEALRARWSPTECGARALLAGSDLLLYYKEACQFSAVYELRRALERGELDPAPVAASLERVRRAKEHIRGRRAPSGRMPKP